MGDSSLELNPDSVELCRMSVSTNRDYELNFMVWSLKFDAVEKDLWAACHACSLDQ